MKDHAPHAPSAIVHHGTEGDRGGRVTALYPIHPTNSTWDTGEEAVTTDTDQRARSGKH